MLRLSACCLALAAWASVSNTATPTVTATSSLVYVTRIRRVQSLSVSTLGRVAFAAEPQLRVSAVGPFLYTVSPMVSWVPGKRTSGARGARSFFALAMKSAGSSGGGALVGANEGTVASALGIVAAPGSWDDGPPAVRGSALAETTATAKAAPDPAAPGSWDDGPPAVRLSPLAETTATATAVPIATVASAPEPMNNSRRRL